MGFIKHFNYRFPNFVRAIVLTEVWETFSYYSLTWLLVVFLVEIVGLPTVHAYLISSLNSLISNIVPIIVGFMCDRWFGFRILLFYGIIMLFCAHTFVSLSYFYDPLLYVGMAFLSVGSGIFKVNNPSLLGSCYDHHPEHPRIAGFTLFYAGINFGGFVSALTSALLSYYVSYHFAFALGAFGMVICIGVYYHYRKLFEPVDTVRRPDLVDKKAVFNFLTWPQFVFAICLISIIPFSFIFAYAYVFAEINFIYYTLGIVIVLSLLMFYFMKTARDRKHFIVLIIYFAFYAFFASFANQVLTTFPLFLETNSSNQIFGVEIPPLIVNVTNPGLIMIAGLLISLIREPSFIEEMIRVFLALISTSFSFLVFYLGAVNADDKTGMTSLAWPFLGTVIISSGEVLIGPLMKGIVGKYMPLNMRGLMMGLLNSFLSLSSLAGMIFAGIFNLPQDEKGVIDPLVSIEIFKTGFIDIVKYNLIACGLFLVVSPLMWYLQKKTKGEKEAENEAKTKFPQAAANEFKHLEV